MIQLLKAFEHSFVRTLLLVTAFSLLAACGGGGGGGGSSKPLKLEITTPAEDGLMLVKGDEVVITFIAAKNPDVSTLSVMLNGVDVTAQFVIAGDESTATADVFALAGALRPGGTSNNRLQAVVDGSKTAQRDFYYTGEPEPVITTVMNGTASGYNGTVAYDADGSGTIDADEQVDGSQSPYNYAVNTTLPQSGDSLDVFGEVRGGILQSLAMPSNTTTGIEIVACDNGQANFVSYPSQDCLINGFSTFYIDALTYTPDLSANDTANFSLVSTGTTNATVLSNDSTLDIVAPGKLLNNMLALQLNNTAFNRVLGKWLGEIIKSRLGQITDANSVTLLPAQGTASVPDAVCQVINNYKDSGYSDFYECDVELLKVGTQNDINTVPDFNVTATTSALPAGSSLDNGWQWTVDVAAQQNVKMKLRFNAYDGSGTKVGYIQMNAVFDASDVDSSPPSLTMKANLGSSVASGAALLGFEIDLVDQGGGNYSTSAFTAQQYLTNVTNSSCNTICGATPNLIGLAAAAAGQIDTAVNELTVHQAYCLQPYTVDYVTDTTLESDCGFSNVGSDHRLAIDTGTVTRPVVNEQYLLTADDANTPNVDETQYLIISAMETMMNKLDYQVSNNGSADVGGFVGLQGYSKTVDEGVHFNALGSHFTTPSGTGSVADANIDDTSDIALAVSSNWVNQLLLSMYQSNVLSTVKPDMVVAPCPQSVDADTTNDAECNAYPESDLPNLGSMGTDLVNLSQGYISWKDPVEVTVSGEAVPSSQFIDMSGTPAVQLNIPMLKLRLAINSTGDFAALQSYLNAATIEGFPNPCENQGIKYLDSNDNPYIELVMDVKARMPLSLDATTKQLTINPGSDDLMLFVTTASGTTIKEPTTSGCELRFEPNRNDLQEVLPAMVSPLLQSQVSNALKPGSQTVCMDSTTISNTSVQSMVQDFFSSGDRVMELVLGDVNVEGEHLLLSASAREQGDTSVTGDAFFSLILQDSTSCGN